MPRILLIDDDEHLAAPLAAYFARFDCTLDAVTRPSDGLARLRAGRYDAAILDVMLPEMDGFALCREIRKESDIPIVMLTARGEVMDRVVGLELGADQRAPVRGPGDRPRQARSAAPGHLYLCRLIAQAHGGRFTVRNAQPGLRIDVLLKWSGCRSGDNP